MLMSYEDLWGMMADCHTTVTAFKNTGDEYSFESIFDNETKEYYVDEEIVSNREPILICRSSDVENINQESNVTIGCTKYLIRDYQPDNWGVTKLKLKKEIV